MPRRRTIAILCGGGLTETAGGIGQLSSYLLQAWSASPPPGVEHVIIDTRGSGKRFAQVTVFALAGWELARLRLSGRLALVHANMSTGGSVLRKCLLCCAARMLGTPVVMHMHGADLHQDFRRQRAPMRALLRATLSRSAGVLVLGEYWRDVLVTEIGVEARLVTVVPNGVPAAACAAGPAADPIRIACLGRLGDRKGTPELLAALARPGLAARDWHATLAGDGEIERFRRAAERHGLEQRVSLPGWLDRTQAGALLRRTDIFVLPSHHEGMPLAILEALAHGVAVVATAVGANGEFLIDQVNAVLVPPGDVEALARALARLIDDGALRNRLAVAGRETFARHFDIRVVAARIADLHEQAIEAGARPRNRRGRVAFESG